ncbi:MAG: type II toxin-antitoxin system PemK/MazF family toxin [Moorea sp. SIO2B7]|nr:type II toxin-antitoxin system PemK/MazF family toxin [Moorena sp. SIO2B7]
MWHIKVEPNKSNELNKTSVIDTVQLRELYRQRFMIKLGVISEELMREITIAIAIIVE